MKKLLKQLLAVTTAIMMAITLLPAMANAETTPTPSHIFDKDSATLTIKKTDSLGKDLGGAEFEIYKVATVNQNITTQLSYDVTDTFKNTITNADVQELGTLSASALEAKAKALADIKKNAEGTYAKGDYSYISGQENSIPIEKDNFGLYLVVETKAPDGYNLGAPFFVDVPRTTENGSAWDYAVVATPKNGSNSLDKKVAVVNEDGIVAAYKTAASVKTGDTLRYTVTGTLPYLTEKELAADDVKITISDTLTGGLAFDETLSLVEFNINGEDVKEKYFPVKQGNNQFTITIEAKKDTENYKTNLAYIKSINGKSITLTYQAKVTNAVTYLNAATNKATIKVGDEEKSKSNEPKVYTYAIKLNKKLGDKDAIKEDGVQFGLYTDPTCTDENRVGDIKTVENGSITFDGLVAEGEEGTTYYLKEEKTAQGYTLLSKPIAVTLIPQLESGQPTGKMKYTIDGNTTPTEGYTEPRLAETTITNNKGFDLPGTGGMGTYIFTIGGLVVMAGAVLLLVSSKKKRA